MGVIALCARARRVPSPLGGELNARAHLDRLVRRYLEVRHGRVAVALDLKEEEEEK